MSRVPTSGPIRGPNALRVAFNVLGDARLVLYLFV